MAIEYGFDMDIPLEPQDALKLLIEKNGFEWGLEQDKGANIFGYGLWIPGWQPPHYSQDLTEEAFGFRPTLGMTFRIQSRDYSVAMKAIIRAVMTLLEHSPGDAVLAANGEYVSLQRLDGELLIDLSSNPLHMELILPEVTLPHEVRVLPQPML